MLLAVGQLDAPTSRATAPCFDQINRAVGSLRLVGAVGPDRQQVFRASYRGGGRNGYARGVHEVQWRMGDEVEYGAWFFLWPGFLDDVQGQVDLLRWDNWPRQHHRGADWGGVSIFGSDRRARLLRFRDGPEPVDELIGPFDLPEGRWFELVVRQRLGARNAHSVVELDGAVVGASSAPNAYGRAIQRLRYGIVAVSGSSQMRPLEVRFHSAHAVPRRAVLSSRCVTIGRRAAAG